jgi:hypothetical protein
MALPPSHRPWEVVSREPAIRIPEIPIPAEGFALRSARVPLGRYAHPSKKVPPQIPPFGLLPETDAAPILNVVQSF